MKTKFTLLIAALIAFSTLGFAQSVKITPKKTTYKRPASTENEYKRTFTVSRPIVSGPVGKKIEAVLSFEKLLGVNIKEEQTEIAWLDDAGFETTYNKNGILNMKLYVEGSGAYPSVNSKIVVIDSKWGTLVTPQTVFVNLPGLAAKADKKLQAEIKKANADYKKDPDSADFDSSEYFGKAKFTAKNLIEFSVSDKGVTLMYDYDFPHVALALEPLGEYFFTWAEMKPFIKSGSIFSQFVK
jgi:hypothetical protein